MKSLAAIILLTSALFVGAQTVATTANVLHPIRKDPNQHNAPTSLDRDPSEKASLLQPTAARPATAASAPAQPAKPAEIVARIDAGLAASKISLVGTVNGIKGRLSVTNIGSQMITPSAQFAICDQKGFQIGSIAKTGQPLSPNDTEKIEVLANNINAVDLKLMKLTAGSEAK
jgi:hypothetical protein